MNLSSLSSGYFDGSLRLSFSSNNPDDWNANDQTWYLPNSAFSILAQDGDGTNASFDLMLLSEAPGEIYVFGSAALGIAGLGSVYGGAIGGDGGIFKPGQPNLAAASSGRQQGVQVFPSYRVTYDIGFKLPMPWNGSRANCAGLWWARWTVTRRRLIPGGHLVNVRSSRRAAAARRR